MIMFFVAAALLVALCLAWLLSGLFRQAGTGTDQEAVNISLARERRQLLDDALADGSIDPQSHETERKQLELDLAADLKLHSERQRSGRRGNIAIATVVALFVPIAAGALYLKLGNPQAITNSDTVATQAENMNENEQAPALAELLPQLEQRLASAPDDVDGWRLLGRTYLTINDFSQAQQALERAVALDDSDVSTLAQLAEAMAMQQNGELNGDARQYLERANSIDPNHEHTLWLLAIARQQAGEHESALQGFDQLTRLSQNNPQALETIDQMRQHSLDAMAGSPISGAGDQSAEPATAQVETPGSQSDSASVAPAESAASENSNQAATTSDDKLPAISVHVSLDEVAAAAVQPDQLVFIYARASEGPAMPLAAARLTVGELPATVTLDESMAMVPGMTLSAFPSITVGARVSGNGDPLPQSGDWYSERQNISHAQEPSLSLNIDRQLP